MSRADEIAAVLARKLLELGNEEIPCGRIQFKLGIWPKETDGGGMNEEALKSFFAKILTDELAKGKP